MTIRSWGGLKFFPSVNWIHIFLATWGAINLMIRASSSQAQKSRLIPYLSRVFFIYVQIYQQVDIDNGRFRTFAPRKLYMAGSSPKRITTHI